MAPSSRPDYKLNLEGLGPITMSQAWSANGSATNSPIEAPAGSGLRYPLGNSQAGPGRAGTGSPSKEYGSRLFPKRAREIQQQEGLSPQIWGPPTIGSGHSTPLRETIPESPSSDSFPDFDAAHASTASTPTGSATGSARRGRAGTVPSRFPGFSSLNGSQTSLPTKSTRGTPATSPYQSQTSGIMEPQTSTGSPVTSNAALLSRLRAGSMPQRSALLGGSSPFGSSLFASNWLAGRERTGTLQSIRSSDAASSSLDSPADSDRTLDYLGLVDMPHQNLGLLAGQQRPTGPTIADLAALNAFNNKNTANRFRSYSVNAKEKYADGEDDELDQYEQLQQMYSGQLTPSAEATAAQAAAIHEAVRQHNLEVQAFANFASANRPRARTAGVLDSPSSRALRNYLPTPSRLDNSITAADLQSNDGSEINGLANALQGVQLNPTMPYEGGLEAPPNMESPTRSLWLGNIPASTTVSSLNVIFGQFGPIEFARVLTHKSCGFVNYENVQSAMAAKAQCNGKEIFPGCGPVRIGYAKEQSASNTPGANGVFPSPSPDPFVSTSRAEGNGASQAPVDINAETAAAALASPDLMELQSEVLDIVQQFGASADDKVNIAANLEKAMGYRDYHSEIPPVPEAGHSRVHDAPRLREIRKRIDNNSCGRMEIENIAMDMIPEIAELSSDYLGNTVVQKLFEHCSEDTKEAMLAEIAPHLSEIGVHKNGTWAAQKIIDVARTPQQMRLIVDALRPYGVSLFLDQYGNYVMQCCLRFQSPLNNFVFETMLNRLWDVSQGRFGARAMRACLESHFATNDQKRLMAAAIALHAVQLATNSNGALLLTWFLDTCTFPKRRIVLAPRLIPHLVHLCTHRVAYLTVLKVINQRTEPDARDMVLNALFLEEQTLTDIISDQLCGSTFIFKVLSTPFLDESFRPECLEKVRNVLIRIKAQPNQGYKRLMDETGLSGRHGATPLNHEGSRPQSKTRQMNGQPSHQEASQNGYGRPPPYVNPPPQQVDQNGLQRTASMDSSSYDPYVAPGIVSPQYTHSPSVSTGGMSPMNAQQIQYQQALLAQAQAQVQAQVQAQSQMPRPGFYTTASPNLSNGAGHMPSGAPPPGMMDPYRTNMTSIPPGFPHQHQQLHPQPAYGNPMMALNGYGPSFAMQQPPPQQASYFPQGPTPAHMNGPMGGYGNRRGR